MRNFFASLFGALIGILLAFFITIIIIIGIVSNAVKSVKEEKPVIAASSVLEIKLNHVIKERTTEKTFNFRLDDNERIFSENSGLNDIIADIRHAATDSHIKGIFLDLSTMPAGIATVETIRSALMKFKESKKFVIAYSPAYSQKSYYLASVADEVYLYPEGELYLKGLSAQVMFYKKALEKLGIQMQVFRHGRFKSYVEPYILDKMSPDNRLQTRMLLTSVWDRILGEVGASRDIQVASINQMADSLAIRSAEQAKSHKLVDNLLYPDQVLDKIKAKLGLTESQNIPFIGLDDYRETFYTDRYSSPKIAVIYAAGEISQGNGDDESIGSARLSRTIREARLDPDVKAIVLRVNSPGGSALAADIIWREVELAKKAKPVIVSMGDLAASGGYYISCAANVIVAEPTTITGSIGVFGMLPNAQELMNDKLGITVDTVSTNTHAAGGSVFYPLQSDEEAVLQGSIEDIYHTFLSRVADGRNLTTAQVDSIAQGRVWSGMQARKIGLTDTLGDMNLAIRIAAQKANISIYSVEELPTLVSPFRKLLNYFSGEMESKALKEELGELYEPVQQISKTIKMTGVQARMPYELIIE
ncbi:MAG: signal peptide peptidase SppA [Bacteroidia bacterium]